MNLKIKPKLLFPPFSGIVLKDGNEKPNYPQR